MTRQNSEDGFTLLETLIAFAILSVSLVVMYQIFTDGFRARTRAERVLMCEEKAARELTRLQIEARAGSVISPGTGSYEDGYVWTVSFGQTAGASSAITAVRTLSEIRVSVQSPNRSASVTLSSLVHVESASDDR